MTVRGFGMFQGSADGKESIHGEFEPDVQLVSLPGMPSQRHPFQIYWRPEHEHTRFHSPFTLETSLPFTSTQSHYRIQVGGFHQQAQAIFDPQVHSCHPEVERQQPSLLTVIPHSYVPSDTPAQLELIAQVMQFYSELPYITLNMQYATRSIGKCELRRCRATCKICNTLGPTRNIQYLRYLQYQSLRPRVW